MRRVGFPREFLDVGSPLVFFAPGHLPEIPEHWSPRGRWRSGAMHTFCDDYRQEFFWRRPLDGALVAMAAGFVTAPDFSVFQDDPPEWAAYQCWRSAVVAAYWQSFGARVLPVVAFGGHPERFVPRGSVWAVRGAGRGADVDAWRREMEAFALRSGAAALVVFGNQVEGLPVPVVGRVLFPGWIKGVSDGRS